MIQGTSDEMFGEIGVIFVTLQIGNLCNMEVISCLGRGLRSLSTLITNILVLICTYMFILPFLRIARGIVLIVA